MLTIVDVEVDMEVKEAWLVLHFGARVTSKEVTLSRIESRVFQQARGGEKGMIIYHTSSRYLTYSTTAPRSSARVKSSAHILL